MEAAQDPRRTRFEAVVDLVAEPLRRYVVRRVAGDAWQDVLSDALLVIWRRIDDVPAGGELPWCYAVARNCVANHDRTERRRRGLLLRVTSTSRPDHVDTGPDLPDPELQAALARLSADDRELLRLWAWEDLGPGEIAAVLGVTANAVSIRLHRARRRLARSLSDVETGTEAGSARDRKHTPPSGQEQVERRTT